MSMPGWSLLSVTKPGERIRKDRGKEGEKVSAGDSSPERGLHPAKMSCRVKTIANTRKDRQLTPKPVCSPDCSAGSSGQFHTICRYLFEASIPQVCMGSLAFLSWPLGLTHYPPPFDTYKHTYTVMQIHQLP